MGFREPLIWGVGENGESEMVREVRHKSENFLLFKKKKRKENIP